jgi:hypothetical protein
MMNEFLEDASASAPPALREHHHRGSFRATPQRRLWLRETEAMEAMTRREGASTDRCSLGQKSLVADFFNRGTHFRLRETKSAANIVGDRLRPIACLYRSILSSSACDSTVA